MILHVDMDAFFASVEQREQPELRGKAVIVGGAPNSRGVVCAASYEAREFGVHSAMPSSRAVRLCPQAIFLPPRMSLYGSVSAEIREVFHRFTPLVEPLSMDEAFLDVSACERLHGSAPSIGRRIKEAIRTELNLVASVGAAPNKFLAKLASDAEKPDGFVVIDSDRSQDFLDPMPVRRLWGVGKRASEKLEAVGVRTIADVRAAPMDLLQCYFGEQAEHFWRLARGLDDRRVTPDRQAKSISHETTFADDVGDLAVLRRWVIMLAEQVAWRLRRHQLFAATVQLKVRFSDFQTMTRSSKLAEPSDGSQEICDISTDMLARCLQKERRPLRLIGVGVGGLRNRGNQQQLLFTAEEAAAQHSLDSAADAIREKFGKSSLRRASGLRPDES
jgi:DNA polymerase-4